MSESATLAMTKKSRELQAKGFDVINLSIGQPDFNVPDFIKVAAKKAVDDNFSQYPPVAGYPQLREAVSAKLLRDNDLHYDANQIVVSTGAKQAIANVFLAILNPGDEVVVPAPYWVSYTELIKLAEGVPVYVETTIDKEFKASPEQIEAAITPKTKAFIFSSPNNPSGTVYSKEELKAIAELFAKYPNISIISDEIYELINFAGKTASIGIFEEIKERVITINGLSKAFAMPGWRLGYSASSVEIAKAIEKVQGQVTSGANAIAQIAAVTALKAEPASCVDFQNMKSAFNERRDYVVKRIADIPGMIPNNPDGAFYVFPNIAALFGKSDGEIQINNDNDLCLYILNKANVALVPGSAFGNSDCIRFSYATSMEQIKEALDRIEKALSLLK
ncbi:MAG: pyridoxal phosphate-dependent aminotransferase [Bacteroidales bacterium]|nr:pyridoxal phosphate-dependent aminotransferase [Bacteroidales bacterium]